MSSRLYIDYVRLYLLMGYSLEDSQFHARLATDDLWERPEPKKQCNNADKEVPEKEDATIPEPEALDEQLLETKDLCERPEPKKPRKRRGNHPRKRRRNHPRSQEALDEQCRIALQPMLQSMVVI